MLLAERSVEWQNLQWAVMLQCAQILQGNQMASTLVSLWLTIYLEKLITFVQLFNVYGKEFPTNPIYSSWN